jgi:hypothetical protein
MNKINYLISILILFIFLYSNNLSYSFKFNNNNYMQINRDVNCTDFNLTCNQCSPGRYFNNCELFL